MAKTVVSRMAEVSKEWVPVAPTRYFLKNDLNQVVPVHLNDGSCLELPPNGVREVESSVIAHVHVVELVKAGVVTLVNNRRWFREGSEFRWLSVKLRMPTAFSRATSSASVVSANPGEASGTCCFLVQRERRQACVR